MTLLLKVVVAVSLLTLQPASTDQTTTTTSDGTTTTNGDVEWEPFPHCYPCPK